MSFKRPTERPRWAWGTSAVRIQPPSGSSEAGFATRAEPPAQWFNWQFGVLGDWVDFLAGPDVEKWSRAQWPGTPASDHFNAPGALAFDVDTVTADTGQTNAAFRMAVVGETSAPAAKMFVSQRGNAWAARTNLPSGVTGPFALKALSSSKWLLGCHESGGDAAIYYADADDGSAAGPLGANGNSWMGASVPASMAEVKAFAELGGAAKLVAACASTTFGVYSADGGATWTACTFGTTPSNNGLDVVADGAKYVWVSQDGEVYNSSDGVTFTATVSLAPGASASWRLCAGATGEVLAYRVGNSSSVDLYLSTDSGASWTAVTQPAGSPKYITQVAYRAGVWVATSSRSPWLWVSNDLTSWRALNPPVDTSSSPAALYNVRFDGGAWVAVGNGLALACGRASDPASGAYVNVDSPSTLTDAGSLRGRRIATTAPTTGQVLVYNGTSGLWEPGAAGSLSPTTTRGDLIRRGASVDERFAAKAADTFVGGDGTDVVVRTATQVRASLGLVYREAAATPVLWYKTDETDTTATTLANSGSQGTAALSLTNAVPGAVGPWGEPALRVASNGYGLTPVDIVRPTGAITVALWFRQNGAADTRLVSRAYAPGGWSAPYAAVSIFVTNGGVIDGSVTISGTAYGSPSPAGFATAGEWHHVALTFDGSTIKTYLDGVLVGSSSHAGTIDYGAAPTTSRWSIGGNDKYPPDAILGKVCDARIYDSALSASVIARMHRRGRGTYDGT